jgi:hypothetical protein
MSMFGPRKGTWWIRSEKDPRWNSEGRADVGGLVIPQECKDKIEELKITLGEPPDDLGWNYMKD